ncbi:hypothetical protein [Bacillus sp. NPDC093026]|uniref:hypothetical protein n=1 Tax=Bacillus sp. NPDC093026 TaxID=3363948 RepID=UPI00380ADB02
MLVVKPFEVAECNRYQIVHQLRSEDIGLNFPKIKDIVVISVVSKQLTKEKLYEIIPKRLEKECGMA